MDAGKAYYAEEGGELPNVPVFSYLIKNKLPVS